MNNKDMLYVTFNGVKMMPTQMDSETYMSYIYSIIGAVCENEIIELKLNK